jgi:hypothetical protein
VHGSPVTPAVLDWDDEQKAVIRAAAAARLLVDAGPGTGKTAVACSRVAWLINKFLVSPANILVVSFTRTAVAEIRQRLAAYIGDEARAASVRIATLDSEAWRLNQGFSGEEANLLGGYDANIAHVTELLRGGSEELEEYLRRFRHLVFDEAQDLTGIRATLALELVRRVPATCGVTVFADPGQAIYGFTQEEGHAREHFQGFLETLSGAGGAPFERKILSRIHRTDSPQLVRVFRDTRPLLARGDAAGHELLRKALLREAAGTPPAPDDLRGCGGHLLLRRYRRDVLRLSQELAEAGVPHRLRMSGTPVCAHPWIGWLLAPLRLRHLDRAGLGNLWDDREMERLFPGEEPDRAFRLLWGLAPGDAGRINIERLRELLARGRPPVEVCATECGAKGPVLGTIHASKGREADDVVLALPPAPGEDDDAGEETRVLYVGATRPRKRLVVHDADGSRAYRLESGRLWCVLKPQAGKPYLRASVEIGLDGDIDRAAGVQPPLAGSAAEAEASQRLLAASAGELCAVSAHCNKEWKYDAYRLDLADHPGCWIGQFRKRVQDDLLQVRRWFGEHFKTKVRTPWRIDRLHLFAVRTVAIADDDPVRRTLHEPFRSSGFLLAPVVIGYPVAFFRKG